MQFIEALKLKSKLVFLFVFITIGLFFLGIMGTINLSSMKKNLDSLYFGSLVPVTELNAILQAYHGGIVSTIYKSKNSKMTPNIAQAQIRTSLHTIDKEWKNYQKHFKRYAELQYVVYTSKEIKSTNIYINKILLALENGYKLKDIVIPNFEHKIAHIDQIIDKLIGYEVSVARYERKNFLDLYDSLLFNVGLILIIVILAVMIISFYVFKSIQDDQTALEVATKNLKKANKKLENVSYTDSLTGLYNRRYFNHIYNRELNRAKRTHSYITFMMLDIDYFKQYNDTYGHIEGDYALKSVAKVLKETLKRPGDFVFRLGGEEFGVLLTETAESDSAMIARKIGDSIREREIKHEQSAVNEYLTISIGVACCIADEALNEETLMTRADEMLYKSKDSGRDRYSITTDVSEATVITVATPKDSLSKESLSKANA